MATDSRHHQLMNWFCEAAAGPKKYRAAVFNEPQVIQAVSSRDYGNMALHTGDLPEKVIENRRLFLSSLSLNLTDIVAAEQIHGTAIQVVGQKQRGAGAYSMETALPGTDALITREPGVVLSIFTADCLPIFIYDRKTPAIAIVHAGWRGTIAQIASQTIVKMVNEFKTDPALCRVAIGPAICNACFGVSADVAERFRGISPQVVMESETGYHVDLALFNSLALQTTGVRSDQIAIADLCTCHTGKFFSYRGEHGTRERLMGIIALQ
ncbi:MAG TPA: peptidoglycan editing factor PgeF [Firmicutes bacterium]|jgi:polyphenol oxidase|nr:peptidoglycan editing factor PgeF [Bacillota bacterium]